MSERDHFAGLAMAELMRCFFDNKIEDLHGQAKTLAAHRLEETPKLWVEVVTYLAYGMADAMIARKNK